MLNLFRVKEKDILILRRVKYLNIVYWANVIGLLVFILNHNIRFNGAQYNIVLIPSYLLFLMAPLAFKKTKQLHFVIHWVFYSSVFLLSFLIYTSGGLMAPGAFWLTVIPLIGGILCGQRGVTVASGVLMFVLTLFGALQYFNLVPNIIFKDLIFDQERVIDLVAFSFYSIVVTQFFVRTEARLQEELSSQKKDLDSLVKILVHDLSNPLMVAELYVAKAEKAMQKEPESENSFYAPIIVKISKSIKNIAHIIQQVKELSALKDGKFGITLEKVEVQSLLVSSLELMKIKSDIKGVLLESELHQTPVYFMANPVVFQNVIINNLISNAIKFTPKDKSILVKLKVEGQKIVIEVIDQGIGMPESILKDLFSFTKLTSRKGTDGEAGTGYGMPLVKAYVERMHGVIQVKTKELQESSNLIEPQKNGIQGGLDQPSLSGTTIELIFNKIDE